MEWACGRCTFLNSSGDACSICEAPRETEDVSESRKRKSDEEETERDSRKQKTHNIPKENVLLRDLHMERMSRQKAKASSSGNSAEDATEETIVFMTYNVWFREDLELEKRMEAIGDLITQHQPHIICFQEVTTTIYTIFQRSIWWNIYKCSVTPELAAKRAYFCMQLSKLPVDRFYRNPFRNSIMGRELCLADLNTGDTQLVVATTHLESPCPAPPKWDQMFSAERVVQAKEAMSTLKNFPNVIFGGDMNWDDKLDGQPPLEESWYDAWTKLRPNEAGLSYDSKANPMLTGSRLQKRLDRIYYRLRDFHVESIEMIGTKQIPGVTYNKEKTVKGQKQLMTLPVLPSDHFGLLLKIRKLALN